MTGSGRPLRFLGLILFGWMAMRFAMLWYATGSLPEALRETLPVRPALSAVAPIASPPERLTLAAPVPFRVAQDAFVRAAGRRAEWPDEQVRFQLALVAMTQFGAPIPMGPSADVVAVEPMGEATGAGMPAAGPRYALPPAALPRASRMSYSTWAIARGGRGVGASLDDPQLGGAQGGVRADYAVGSGLALTGRLAAPAAGSGREASVGLAWRPRGVPLRLVAEQRIALDGGRGGPALGVSGGVSELAMPARFRLEAYGQGGAIARRGVEPYADGSARLARSALALAGVEIDAGAGAWGGAQRGVARLDVGPTIGARVPVIGKAVRLSLDWRQRVAGSARPGSGPSLSIGSDF